MYTEDSRNDVYGDGAIRGGRQGYSRTPPNRRMPAATPHIIFHIESI